MKLFRTLAVSMALLGFSLGAQAAEYTKGEITKVNADQKKITIKHEELKSLDMPAMTMVFVVASDDLMKKARVGAQIEFIAERLNGRITVTDIK
jgi:Cu/Ag efflux protein CusF